jgi:hypothetical protein
MNRMAKCLARLALLGALIAASSAGASEKYFIFTFSGSGVDAKGNPVPESGSAFLGGISIGNGAYLVNHVAGTANDQPLSLMPTATVVPQGCPPQFGPCYSDTSFAPSDAVNDFVFDNVINMSGTGLYLDVSGLGLKTSSGDNINIFGVSGSSQYFYFDDAITFDNTQGFPVTVNISPLTPSAAISSLSTSLANFGFLFGAKVTDDLASASTQYSNGDVQAACEAMTDFVADVHAQGPTRWAKTLAVTLTAQARITMLSIGCFRS